MNATHSTGRVYVSGLRWIVTTTIGYAIGVPLSMLLLGAFARPLSPILGGMLYILLFGAVVGLCVGACQLWATPREPLAMPSMILATPAGAALGFAVAAVVGEGLGNVIDPTISVVVNGGIIQITSGAFVGLAVGVAQWLVFRPYLRGTGSWLLASMTGAGLGYGAAAAILELFEIPLLKAALGLSFGAILGLFVGFAQALVLRSTRRATEARSDNT
jgi:hypothetical protein